MVTIFNLFLMRINFFLIIIHRKSDFTKKYKNLVRYRSKNNFIKLLK